MLLGISSVSSPSLISVIIPTYNYGRLIGQTLESVSAQTYQNWECVVVDDGSTDDTSEVVNRYAAMDARIKYIKQDNRQQAAARNNAIRNSNGEYFQFLDADDLIEPKKFERQIEYLESHPDVDIVYTDVRFFSDENIDERYYLLGGENKPWMPGVSGRGKEVLMSLVRKDTIPINTPLVRRRVIDKVGLFDEKLSPVEDWDYWVRCAAEGMRFQYKDFEETHALVRYHASSASRSGLRMLKSILLMRKKIMGMAIEPDVLRLNKELTAEEEGFLGVEEVLNGSLLRGTSQLSKAAILDRRVRHKAKWLVCAFVAPFVSRHQFQKIYSASLSQFVTDALPPLISGRR